MKMTSGFRLRSPSCFFLPDEFRTGLANGSTLTWELLKNPSSEKSWKKEKRGWHHQRRPGESERETGANNKHKERHI
jgi:hypothetical protein